MAESRVFAVMCVAEFDEVENSNPGVCLAVTEGDEAGSLWDVSQGPA